MAQTVDEGATTRETGARTAVYPADVPRSPLPFSPAIKAGGWVFVGGRTATDFQTATAEAIDFDPRRPYRTNRLGLESDYVYASLAKTLAAAGGDLRNDVARVYVWVAAPHPTYEEFLAGSSTTEVHIHEYVRSFYAAMDEPRPASAALGIRELLAPGNRIGLELIAIPGVERTESGIPDDLPSPIAKYSPAVRFDDWVFLAGDLATDFQGDFTTTEHMGDLSAVAPEARVNPYMWYGSSIEQQTDYLLHKLSRIAEEAGTSLDRCVKADVYMGHPQDWLGMDRVWRQWFPENPPARTTVPYCGLAGRGCRIEISMALLHGDSKLEKATIQASAAPEPHGHEPQAIAAGDFLFFSTQLPLDSNGVVPEALLPEDHLPYVRQRSKLQAHYMLDNMAAICEAAGTSLDNLCRCQMFFEDFGELASSVEEWATHFTGDTPAANTVRVGGPLIVPGAHVLYDAIGYIPR
jgi:enamine deaminase RidA (YjgF/YER057c/UK114 family)